MELGSVCKQGKSFWYHNSLNYNILPARVWIPDFGVGIGKKYRTGKKLEHISDSKILHKVGVRTEGCGVALIFFMFY